jgi:hypothetical protein
MRGNPARARGPLPDNVFVVRPVGPVILQMFPLTRRRRLWSVLAGLAALGAAFFLFRPTDRTVPVFLFLFLAIVAWSYVWMRQPGTFVYVSSDRVGVRTVMGSRYEVPREAVSVVRVAAVSSWGASTPGVVLEADDGRRLLSQQNANYDQADLRQLAKRIGADFRAS